MTAETSNAREWVLVPREPSAGMWDAAESAMIESECAYNAGDPAARSDAHGFPTMRIWQAVVGYRAMLAAAPPPAAAEPKTLPVPTRVYLIDKAAVIAGHPQRGWDEDGPDAHNCDDMGCSTFGRHVLARVPFTDERDLAQQPAAVDGSDAQAAEVEALRAEVERANSWNERVSVCRDHVADIVDGPCVICALGAAEARAERLEEALREATAMLLADYPETSKRLRAALGQEASRGGWQSLTDEHKAILKECRNQAMRWTLVARIPECGIFGGIAQDLDYLCEQLGVKDD